MKNLINFIQGHPALIVTCILIGFIGFGVPYGYIKNSKEHKDTCNSYCNCQTLGNCSYTFDYNEVKDCECEK